MSRHHVDPFAAQASVVRTVARSLQASDHAIGHKMNRTVEKTGEAVILLSSYLSYRLDAMIEALRGENSPFSLKIRNRTNHIIRACDELAEVLEPLIEGEKRDAYCYFTDALHNSLDSYFDDMHRDEPEPKYNVIRRAKLRYHDPYSTDVAERTAAFEDGYVKGYTDAMDDLMRQLAEQSDGDDKMMIVDIGQDGKATIKPAEP